MTSSKTTADPPGGRQYGQDALAVARAVARCTVWRPGGTCGVKASADREANLVEQVVAPQLRQRGPGARDAAARTAWQIGPYLAAARDVVESALAEAGLATAPLRAGGTNVRPADPA